MTIFDAAKAWGVQPKTVYVYLSKRLIPGAVKVRVHGLEGNPTRWEIPDDATRPVFSPRRAPKKGWRRGPSEVTLERCMKALHRAWADRGRSSLWSRLVERQWRWGA